jgi:DNA-binding transcriptional LysR family regulator
MDSCVRFSNAFRFTGLQRCREQYSSALPLPNDVFVVCLPEGHRLVGLKAIDPRELIDESFILFSRDSAPASHDQVIGVFSRFGMHPRIVHAARMWLTIVAMVSQGCGVALVPRSLTRVGVDRVRFLPIEGAPSHIPVRWHGPGQYAGGAGILSRERDENHQAAQGRAH